MPEENTGLLEGFKAFVMRGNVVDLAVAVVVGAAFTAVIASFTENIIDPVIAAFGGGDLDGFGFCVRAGDEPCTSESATFVDFGAVVAVLLSFVITMAVVYFVFVRPINHARALAKKGAAEPEAEPIPPEVELLSEIRDLLATSQDPTRARDSERDSGSSA